MDSKILILLVIGVGAIVIIAFVIVYEFAQQQYAIREINSQIENEIKLKNVEDCETKETKRALDRNEPVNYDACDYLLK